MEAVTAVSIAMMAQAVVADSERYMVRSDLCGHLGRALHHGLHHGVVGHSVGGWQGEGVVGVRQGQAVVGDNLGISLSLGQVMTGGQTVMTETVTVGGDGSGNGNRGSDLSVGEEWSVGKVGGVVEKRRVVDERCGSGEDLGVTV